MIIFAPRMFKNMQLRDGLKDIAESFQLEANYENMFKIVQAEGGKSGEFFFFTTDNKYILKTINNEELTLLT
jgi:1-phosphatidylinositol-4-phosphate 5-kinase